MSLWYREIETVDHATIYYNFFSWNYPYEIVYNDSSVIMSVSTLDEARKYARIEDERRQVLVMKKLKEG